MSKEPHVENLDCRQLFLNSQELLIKTSMDLILLRLFIIITFLLFLDSILLSLAFIKEELKKSETLFLVTGKFEPSDNKDPPYVLYNPWRSCLYLLNKELTNLVNKLSIMVS